MAMWNAWRGCKKCSDGCLHCYIHKGDFKRNVNTNEIVKTKGKKFSICRLVHLNTVTNFKNFRARIRKWKKNNK